MRWGWLSRRTSVWIFQRQEKILKFWANSYSQCKPLSRFPVRALGKAGEGQVALRGSYTGVSLVPETLRISLQKTLFLSYSNWDLCWGQTVCQASAKWPSYVLPICTCGRWHHTPHFEGGRESLREGGTSPQPQLVRDEKGIQNPVLVHNHDAPRPLQTYTSLQQTKYRFAEKVYIMHVSKDINHINWYCVSVILSSFFS